MSLSKTHRGCPEAIFRYGFCAQNVCAYGVSGSIMVPIIAMNTSRGQTHNAPKAMIYWPGFLLSLILIGAILISGFWWFRRMERTFADVV